MYRHMPKKQLKGLGCRYFEMSARGGTDGSRLSFMGLPCPNMFTGEMAFHGKHEYVSVQDMQKSVEIDRSFVLYLGREELS